MKALHKKLLSVLPVYALLIGGAVIVSREKLSFADKPVSTGEAGGAADAAESGNSAAESGNDVADAAVKSGQSMMEARQAYESAPTDLIFWYEDDSYTAFFEETAMRYYAQTGVKVSLELRSTLDYIGDIYDKTMQDDAFPDVYLLPGDNLEEAYLYGLVSVNERGAADTGAVEKAAMAATYGDKLLGYPLSFNTCVFICQPDYFGTVPESLQSIIDYSNENEPGEDVEYLLEWDVNDAFYDFPFIGNSVTFEKNETDTMNVIYDEELYQQDLEYFDTILASFSVDAGQVSEARIIENFLAGRTLSAIIDTDSLYKLEGHPYELMKMPDLNETLPAATCAMTDMLIVNDYTGQPDAAAEFAQFVTGTMAGDLYDLSGHFSVIPSGQPTETERIAFDAYETSVLVPDSKDARDFWVSVQTTILKYFD